ncbi:MAG: hypothetical protein WA350_18440, partial [Candidatus Sulfotelmatobacter sp.]
WTIVLLGIGFSCNSKVKRTTAIVIVARVVFILEVGRRGTRGPVLEAGCNSPRDRNVLNLQCAG